jgi:hypothetical protein
MYLKDDNLLPVLNNQVTTANSSSYKKGMEGVKTLFLSEATQDTVVYPYQSEQFGEYAWASTKANPKTLEFLEGEQYTFNYLGLKERYDVNSTNSSIILSSFPGDHIRFSDAYWDDVIIPLLK